MGRCGLCIQERPLEKSHQISKALFRLGTKDGGGPNLLVGFGGILQSVGNQPTARFLCKDCEDLLSRNGESFVIGSCFRKKGHFPLLERLQAATPDFQDSEGAIYDGPRVLGAKDFEALIYFGTSIFWRTSAGQWRWLGKPYGTGSIPRWQEESLRRYLIGQDEFPLSQASLEIHVSSNPRDPATTFIAGPLSEKRDDYILHGFFARGLYFMLHTGDLIPLAIKQRASTGPLHPIYLQRFESSDMYRLVREGALTAAPTASVRRKIETLRKARHKK